MSLSCLLAVAAVTCAAEDAAILRTGGRVQGQWVVEGAAWSFHSTPQIAVDAIHAIHFPDRPTPIAPAPLTHLLWLPGGQFVSGQMVQFDKLILRFRPWWGREVTLKQGHHLGVTQMAGWRTLKVQDGPSSPWRPGMETGRVTLSLDKVRSIQARVGEESLTLPSDGRLVQCQFGSDGWRWALDDRVLRVAMGPLHEIAWDGSVRWMQIETPMKPLPRPAKLGNDGELWLPSGDQLFGAIRGNDIAMSLESPLGKRSFPWSDLRGFFVGGDIMPPTPKLSTWIYRPGPGTAGDRIEARLIGAEKDLMTLESPIMGRFTLDRAQLDRLLP